MTQRIGKFELRNVLGKGASGTVYLALDTFSGQDVALKVLAPEVVSDPEFDKTNSRQFMNEASLAGKLSHPHIAAILEASVNEDSGYIAMEYVPGGNLSQFTSPERLLSVEDAIEIAFKSCGALDYAFRQGIVHRDIKPANIMVAGGTNIKVADFGAAYLHRAQETQITDIGTPLYMSPEQLSGQPLGHQSDMFALGAVLYELFTGRQAFVASSLTELFKKILSEDPIAPSALRPGLSKDVDRFVMQMLKKAPEERYPTWADLALDLADIGRLSVYQHVIPDSEKFGALKKVPLLTQFSDAQVWELVHAARWTRLPPQSVIVREDEPGQSLFILAGGEAKVIKQGRLLGILNRGECFGEMAFIKKGAIPRQATVESMTDVLLAEVESGLLKGLSERCQLHFSQALLGTLVDRLTLADARIVQAPR